MIQYVIMYFLISTLDPKLTEGRTSKCPLYCRCFLQNKLFHAECVGQRLASIDADVPTRVQTLNLNNNSISSLENNDFLIKGLTSLRELSLQDNKISTISIHAFAGLKKLRILDLSRNHLHYLLQETFEDISGLTTLYLSGNRFSYEEKPFIRLPALQVLDISSCHFGYFGEKIFSQIPILEILNLANNQLIGLDVNTIRPLHRLKKIDLSSNPWKCNDESFELQSWLRTHNIDFNEFCKHNKDEGKFQRMVSVVHTNETENVLDKEIVSIWSEGDYDVYSIEPFNTLCNTTTFKTNSKIDHIFQTLKSIPAFWALVAGFFLGVFMTVMIMALSLTNCCFQKNCCSNYRSLFTKRQRRVQTRSRRTRILHDNQMFELLMPSCPDTPPPPPYSEIFQNRLSRSRSLRH